MAQKRRKNAVLVSVLLPVELIREIDGRVEHLGVVSRNPPRSRSEWIKRAIRRDLEHDARSRKRHGINSEASSGLAAVSRTTQVVAKQLADYAEAQPMPAPSPRASTPPTAKKWNYFQACLLEQ
jgi:metal-responsive CopG/Arc/MetJ family transcriptional regulator